jgi:hypothetical protein
MITTSTGIVGNVVPVLAVVCLGTRGTQGEFSVQKAALLPPVGVSPETRDDCMLILLSSAGVPAWDEHVEGRC